MQNTNATVRHPLGNKATVLLSSVFGPYAQDDEYGSRTINPMELYHNQVTRFQGSFSLRMFHRSWGLMLIQANISAPCTLLDFPTRQRFIEELCQQKYDIIGISSIQANYLKVAEMCRLARQYQPAATIVVGGHVANLPNLRQRIDVDHIVLGEGVRWFRRFLGEDERKPINHPRVFAGFGARTMGINLRTRPQDLAATLIPSVGCPLGCNFCATSAMFGGRGASEHFYETGDELFAVMLDLEREMRVSSFFIMDENFLIHRRRALRLLELMRHHGKDWSLFIFSSAGVLQSYEIEDLVGLGIAWVWMGLEGEDSKYAKLRNIDTRQFVRTLQSHGIRVLGSTIIGLEEHTPANLDKVIEYAVSHDADFHQFMLYTPLAGTPLFNELKAKNLLLDPECLNAPDWHGQLKFAHRHESIPAGLETQALKDAFERDFAVNGPSIIRLTRTFLQGFLRYRNSSDARIRSRAHREANELIIGYAAGLWATARWYRRGTPAIRARIASLQRQIYAAFGLRARAAAWLMGPVVYLRMQAEARRLKKGWRYEPQVFCDRTNKHPEAIGSVSIATVAAPECMKNPSSKLVEVASINASSTAK
ncbi:MAG: cobalamin-dependent protein [Planctomycetota bacterium]